MKKIILIVVSAILFTTAFTGCAKSDNVQIIMPNGAPALVFAKMMSDTQSLDGKKIDYSIVNGTEGLLSKINEFDIALMPTNMAAKLYNENEPIQLISVNVHGVLYMVGTEEIESLSQLIGKTVYNIGMGGTPDITLKYILEQNEIEFTTDENDSQNKVLLKYEQEGSTVAQKLIAGIIEYAVIGEPVVTQVLLNSDNVIALDIQQQWQIASGLGIYPQVSLVAKKAFIDDNPQFIQSLISELNQDISSWIIDNTDEAKSVIASHGGVLPVLNESSVQNSNINYVSAVDAKTDIEEYLQCLIDYNENILSVPPDDGFYYIP